MQIEFPEEDQALIPVIVGSMVIAVAIGAHLIRFSREQKKIREQIRKDADEEIASIRLETEIMTERMDVAKHRHRARMNEILNPLREQGLIDF